ncbi:hypothetical protein GGI43DRAFT_400105 [Trichoderma evansii]
MTALPLSGCPLKRLEIHGGPTCNTYDAASLESSLTATLEAQRSTTGSHGNLLLQSHLGLRRVFSAQLTDLSVSSSNERQAIKIYQPSLRISIQIYPTEQTVIFYFERGQDFNHAITMLKRIGFRVQDGIPSAMHTYTTTELDSISRHRFGPRLSSFTPLRSEEQQLPQPEFSFTSMLNSDVPLTQLLPSGIQDPYIHQSLPYDMPQQSYQRIDPATTYVPHKNLHQIPFSQQKKTYQPRISSPLRYAVPANNQGESPNLPKPNSQPIFFTDHADIASSPVHRSVSEPNLLSNPLQLPETSVTSYDTPSDYLFGPPGSQESNTTIESSSQVTDTTDDDLNLQLGQDFRRLMPRTRSLPFLKGRDHKVATMKPRNEQNQQHNNSHEKGAFIENADVSKEKKTKILKSKSTNSQLILRRTPPQSKASQVDDTLTYHSSLEITELSTMLITDPTLLERANKATSKLLDQYSADVSRGCNAAIYAEFYLERIYTARKEFWLKELDRMDWNGSGSLYRT